MTDKVLVADDSLTIQKVVGITLAGDAYELVEAHTEADLFTALENDEFKLVLLDFNLSEDKSGYDLSQLIRKQSPQTAIMAMLGTFDTVDDNQMEQSGIDDKIVKPFDSDKFIQKCRFLIEEGSDIQVGETNFEATEAPIEMEASEPEAELGAGWVVDSPKPQDDSSSNLNSINTEQETPATGLSGANFLAEEMMGWGMEVPGVIGTETSNTFAEFPPVIDESEAANTPAQEISAPQEVAQVEEIHDAEEEVLLPEGNDLDYPDMGAAPAEEPTQPTSKLVSVDELSAQDEVEEDLDATDPGFQMPEDFTNDLANEIEEEVSADEFWAVDESDSSTGVSFEEEDEPYIAEESTTEEIRITAAVMPEPTAPAEVTPAPVAAPAVTLDEDAIVAKLTENMKPMIEQLIKQYCEQSVEQVAWEVIPDLAENLIKKEIKDLADSVR